MDLNVIDISNYQKNIHIKDLPNVHGVSSKLTESTGYVSPSFTNQFNQCVESRKLKAAYHWAGSSISKRIASPDSEANFFYSHLKSYVHRVIPVLDWEPYGYNMKTIDEIKWATQFCYRIHSLTSGVWPVIYMDFNHVNMWNQVGGNLASSFAKNVALWVAGGNDYNTRMGFTSHPRSKVLVPNYWTVFGWQYTSHGSLNGYYPLDLNSVYVTADAWNKYANPTHSTSTPKPTPKPSGTSPMHGHVVPSMIRKGTDRYFGSISGPAKSLGGAHVIERPYIKLIQKQLIRLGYVPGIHDINSNWANGIYDTARDRPNTGATSRAVKDFQHDHLPKTTCFGQVWWDDWIKLASF